MTTRLLLFLVLAVPGVISAQDRQTVSTPFCPPDAQPDYGFVTIDCVYCEITARGQSWVVFHRPPVVRGVRRDGPAAGLLVDGDTLVAIDGIELTTLQGARRFAGAAAGDTVEFRVRRGSGVATVRVPVGRHCAWPGGTFTWYARPHAHQLQRFYFRLDTSRMRVRMDSTVLRFAGDSIRWTVATVRDANLKAPIRFSYNLTPTIRHVTHGDSARPTPGWIGIAMFRLLRTPDQLRSQDVAGAVFTELPEIAAVAPGSPADSAGIVAGDTLLAVDGASILTAEGTRRFLEAPVGVPLQLSLRRGGTVVRVRVVPQQPPPEPPAPAFEARRQRD